MVCKPFMHHDRLGRTGRDRRLVIQKLDLQMSRHTAKGLQNIKIKPGVTYFWGVRQAGISP